MKGPGGRAMADWSMYRQLKEVLTESAIDLIVTPLDKHALEAALQLVGKARQIVWLSER